MKMKRIERRAKNNNTKTPNQAQNQHPHLHQILKHSPHSPPNTLVDRYGNPISVTTQEEGQKEDMSEDSLDKIKQKSAHKKLCLRSFSACNFCIHHILFHIFI